MPNEKQLKLIKSGMSLLVIFLWAGAVVEFLGGLKPASSTEPTIETAQTNALPDVQPPISLVANQQWFGSSVQKSVQVRNEAINSLLELRGISATKDQKMVGAYIAEKGKPESYYRPGDVLPGGRGVVDEVFTDYVVIRNGRELSELHYLNGQ